MEKQRDVLTDKLELCEQMLIECFSKDLPGAFDIRSALDSLCQKVMHEVTPQSMYGPSPPATDALGSAMYCAIESLLSAQEATPINFAKLGVALILQAFSTENPEERNDELDRLLAGLKIASLESTNSDLPYGL